MKRHALFVGSFVIGALVLLVIGIIWLSGNALFQQELRAAVYFKGSVNGLYVGAPVTFRGVPVGRVESIGIEVDDQTLNARIPVLVSIRADAVQFSGSADAAPPDLPALVQRGLRARLLAQSFVTGQKYIELDFAPNTPAVFVSSGPVPEIPTLGDRFDALIDQVAELPLRETVQDLRATLKLLQETLVKTGTTLDTASTEIAGTAAEARKTLASASTALDRMQSRADSTLDSVSRLADSARETVTRAGPDLQQTLASARDAADSARLAMNRVAELTAPGTSLRADLDSAVRDLALAARGLREWSEVLEEKPNAVIFGKD
ncbi:MlaD family protein [Schlegelella sp. S2-27]|uniref:MlaD family protein n=1 Tax=Caldimonas mangrovi TaxID=2944811 RepID=A0ABT0YLV5_9BURK|nr:MlaD family protein [Caldimonas mangrovi]MCM5679217.1 MlaD family protein [Caldimonas mangrovi]